MRSSNTDLNTEVCENAMVLNAYPIGVLSVIDNVNGADEGWSRMEPSVGLEFDTADDAREFYSQYAERVGFKIRIGQLYRSRTDGSVSSRRFVCSKEGFQLNSRTGCSAYIRVQKRDSGKWVLDQMKKDHNHEFDSAGENSLPTAKQRNHSAKKSSVNVSHRPKIKSFADGGSCPSGVINFKRLRSSAGEGECIPEPYAGLEFNSANEAYQFYQAYAEKTGFRVRIGQLFRSKNDGSVTSRRFVCSKEGFQHPSRVGCGAFMRIKRKEFGSWIVDRLQKDHNHDLESQMGANKKTFATSKKFIEDVSGGLDSVDLAEINNGSIIKISQENNIGSAWYRVLFEYFQTRQSEDTGFFHSVEVDNGRCMSVFWADGRSRFSCSQFGDAIIFDTSYRKTNYLIPFATFVGINHHRHPVLLGCALVANESKESFTWLFNTWIRAMFGCHPKTIIADQDKAIQQAIARIFPRTHHRFSMWQIRAKERENLRSMSNQFVFEYNKCIYQSQSIAQFSTMWTALIEKYGQGDNIWLKEMYEKRESWVPLYLRRSFFAGIPIGKSIESFFGATLTAQTPLREFISRYTQGLERRREEEKKEDFNTWNLQAFLQTKEPIEEQCRRLYTRNMFKIFQNELLQSFDYLVTKTNEEATIVRYLVRKCGNEDEKHVVTFSALNVSCSCQMFEFEGMLCGHILKVFNLMNVKEIPSQYILHRWTRNAEYGVLRDTESGFSAQELKALMVWSLRETASKYVESGTGSLEKHKLAYEIMREGGNKLCWQR